MRIGIDARFLTHPQPGGFKTYTENLIAALAAVDHENDYVLYVDRPAAARVRLPDRGPFRTCVIPGTLPLLGMPWREQIRLPIEAARDGLDLLHSPVLTAPLFLRCPSVVTVHDMFWHTPTHRPVRFMKHRLMDTYNRHVPRRAIRRAAALITVSHSAKASIIAELAVSPDRVFVTHEAPPPIFVPVTNPSCIAGIRGKYRLGERIILGMGSADPRKNVGTLLQAYAALPVALRAQHELVLVWAHSALLGDVASRLTALRIEGRVRTLIAVPDEDLVLLYNAATAFVFPSRAEGFGLPPLEAMACGTPVIAANNSAMPEILDGAACLVEAHDAHAMAAAIERVLRDDTWRASLIEAGYNRAAAFSWTRCAKETLKVYRKVPQWAAARMPLQR